jgi:transposase
LVTQNGFPLSYEIFSGNTFEGKTMLPIVYKFIEAHKHTNPIVVADAAMLDEERLLELQNKDLSYIVGARLANSSVTLIKQIQDELKGNDKAIVRHKSKYGYLVCDFSQKRFKKDLNEFNRLLKKAEDLVAKQSTGKKATFVKKISKDVVELNVELIEKRKLLLGIKGYVTNIPGNKLSNEKVISNYHQLWHVEQSFRMSKHDLQSRPIYHFNEKPVKAHVLICFVALILQKYLELKTGLSLREIRNLIWNITETHIQDTITKEVFTFRSPMANINESPLTKLIKDWGGLPH